MKIKKHNVSAKVFYSVIIALALVLPNMASAAPLLGTGQTKCYNNTIEIPCPQPGEPFYGQDANYICNPHSYADLGNGIVKDNVTGLEWQQTTAPGTYAWQQAVDYCNNLSLGGKNDWRLPTIKELSTLVDSSIPSPGPAINKSYFPDTQAYYYWSSTTIADSPNYAWYMLPYNGCVGFEYKTGYYKVRAVRGGQTTKNFIDNSDGTITDTSTGLMWQKATAPGRLSWEQALTSCENLTLVGYSDWRLPNRNELQSIVDYSRYNPSIDTTYFSGTVVAEIYWSSTTYAGNPSNAWYVNFYSGGVNDTSKTGYYVRAVRGGQCSPTVINLSLFTATTKSAGKVIVNWNTESETDNAGFNIYRSEAENGEYSKINDALIPAKGSSTQGASYEFTDTNVQNRKTFYYKLEDIDLNGQSTMHGPVNATPRLILGIFK
jgi:hypothetical protein